MTDIQKTIIDDRDDEAIKQQNEAILKARAQALAAKQDEEQQGGEIFEVVEFLLNDEKYAVELLYIREVYPLGELTELPGVPPFVVGVVNVRGKIISVNDIRKFFEIPAQGIADTNRIIILESPVMAFGILADAIVGVRLVNAQDMVPSLPTLTGIRAKFLKGVTTERIVILDGAKLLADQDIIIK